MPRPGGGAFWSGTISFGLISVPVRLFPASRGSRVSLRMLDEDGTPLRRRFYCPAHERLVEDDEIARGYEFEDEDEDPVVVTDEELEAVSPGKSREIDLKRFVAADSIPPLFFERAYFLTPSGDTNKAYRLLADVMERTGRAGMATFVMRNKEYLVAILAEAGILRAETLRFHGEVRSPADVGLEPEPDVDDADVKRFTKAIDALVTDELDLNEMKDESAEELRELAARKAEKGEDVVEVLPGGNGDDADDGEASLDEDDEEDAVEVDLLETIRMSLRSGNGASS